MQRDTSMDLTHAAPLTLDIFQTRYLFCAVSVVSFHIAATQTANQMLLLQRVRGGGGGGSAGRRRRNMHACWRRCDSARDMMIMGFSNGCLMERMLRRA